jgi:hypothetical protein
VFNDSVIKRTFEPKSQNVTRGLIEWDMQHGSGRKEISKYLSMKNSVGETARER